MKIINQIRKNILEMCHYSKSSHIGSCFSIVEILYVLYFNILNIDAKNFKNPNRDRFILSKGHASAALYSVLAEKGFFPKELLKKYYIDGGILPGHLDMSSVNGIEASAGSLGHGLSIGVGMAIASKNLNNPYNVYVLVGDGECNEGSVWEAIMLASTLKLKNLTLIVDFNGLQGFGKTNEVIEQSNLSERLRAFGWETYEVEGHNTEKIENILRQKNEKPKAIIAYTIKGKGVSFMENKLEWHYKSTNEEEYNKALSEFNI